MCILHFDRDSGLPDLRSRLVRRGTFTYVFGGDPVGRINLYHSTCGR